MATTCSRRWDSASSTCVVLGRGTPFNRRCHPFTPHSLPPQTGLVVHGVEYTFAGGSGVFSHAPRQPPAGAAPGEGAAPFRCALALGECEATHQEVQRAVDGMRGAWPGESYHVLRCAARAGGGAGEGTGVRARALGRRATARQRPNRHTPAYPTPNTQPQLQLVFRRARRAPLRAPHPR